VLRQIPPTLDPAAVAAIDARLQDIRMRQCVAMPLAIESGSRAWGFPSPDSDYDCRFIFVRRVDDYLSLFASRDVIETPLTADLDVNGWDLAKALKLLLKGNAVVIEWLTSPIIYSAERWFRDEFLALARSLADRDLVARHYLHLGERQRHAYFADDRQFQLKKLFYALRPAAALRWLRLHPAEAVAPMHFPTLIEECEPPDDIRRLTRDLVKKKSVTRELGSGEMPSSIASFIDSEFESARVQFNTGPRPASHEARAAAQRFFCTALDRAWPSV
jgi:uncharacterized protein